MLGNKKVLDVWKKHKVNNSRASLEHYMNASNIKGGRLRTDLDKIHKHYEEKKKLR